MTASPDSRLKPTTRLSTWRGRLLGGPGRVPGLDVARGLAVIGMFAVHLADVGNISWSNPSTWAGIALGRSAILFATLAGVSIAIMTGGRTPYTGERAVQARTTILVRAVALVVLGGLLSAYAATLQVILEYYGILFLVALVFVRWPVRRLILIAALWTPFGVLAVTYGNALLNWLYAQGANSQVPAILEWTIHGVYPVAAWTPFCLAGLAIGRLNLTHATTAWRLCGVGLALAVVGYGANAAAVAWWDVPANTLNTAIEETGPAQSSDPGNNALSGTGDRPSPGVPAAGKTTGEPTAEEPTGGTPTGPALGPLGGTPIDPPPAANLRCEDFGWKTECVNAEYYQEQIDLLARGNDGLPETPTYEWPTRRGIFVQLMTATEHSSGGMEILGSGGFAILVIGICLLIARPLRFVLSPVAAMGSMALTMYCGQMITFTTLVVWGGDWMLHGGRAFLVFIGVALLFATVWRAVVGRGPLESGLRTLCRRFNEPPATPFTRSGGDER